MPKAKKKAKKELLPIISQHPEMKSVLKVAKKSKKKKAESLMKKQKNIHLELKSWRSGVFNYLLTISLPPTFKHQGTKP